MMKKIFGLMIVITLWAIGLTAQNGSENMHYGYISYLDGNAKVVRLDGSQARATVNLPLVPGDKIITGENDRCEIQFDNGTVMRLDKATVLRIETILARSLTSSRKLTTLHLEQGEIYSLVKSYKRENFQVITPNAAILMKNNSLNTVDFASDRGTSIFVERGRVKVLYGSEARKVKWETVKRKKGFRVTPSHQFVDGLHRDMEFVFWNEKINKNYRELHFGVSRVPKPIYKYSKGVVEFAQKWSTLYGEWIYDDIFGYVWRPYENQFAYSQRPFYHAQYVNVNGQLFLVPSQRWGWAPAHLGTWVWMNKKGWVWIPGDAFSPGAFDLMHYMTNYAGYFQPYFYWVGLYVNNHDFFYGSHFSLRTFSYWFNHVYNSDYGYWTYHRGAGDNPPADTMSETAPRQKRKRALKDVPKSLRQIFKRMDKMPLSRVKEKIFGQQKPADARYLLPRIRRLGLIEVAPVAVRPVNRGAGAEKKVTSRKSTDFRTWCPDKRWGLKNQVKVQYSRRFNAVICKELGLNSNHLTVRQRIALRHGNSTRLIPGISPGLKRFRSSSFSSSSSSTAGTSSHAGTTRTSGGGSKGGKKSK
jgi:hypothetical protein